MKTLDLVQGSEEWLAARKEYFTASEAPAMMGNSKYISRTQLLDHKKGWTTEVDEFTKRLFEKGHQTEQLALPIAEKLIDDELYPVVGILEGTKLLASFDGLTLMEDTVFEHKLYAKTLAENVLNDVLEPNYFWQLEHQLLVSGAEKVIFVVSDGTENNFKHMFYESVPERREALVAGWAQFEKDLESHTPQAKQEKVVAEEVRDLPAIKYEMNGLSLISNLDDFKQQSDALVELSQKPLETDQDFANAESRQKIFTKAEADIKSLADRVLSEVADIDAFTKDLRYIGEQIRQARLAEGKQIKSRKEQIRCEILSDAQASVDAFTHNRNLEIKAFLPTPSISIADEMKGKKSVDSLKDAADTAVSKIKIDATEQADIAKTNIETLKEFASDHKFLFNDWKDIAFKGNDDFTALVKTRIAEHKEQEEKRLEAERERIRAEEQEKAKREAEAKAKTERNAEGQAKPTQEVKSEEPAPYLTKPNFVDAQASHAKKESEPVRNYRRLNDYQQGYVDGLERAFNNANGDDLDELIEKFLQEQAA
jgi:putative phage-type endonuclease